TQLGRHRRAAYIFAELLGDLEMAANALKTGKHFREAAVLYHTRLGRADEAARCLEQGGLWTEAIALYEELKDFEQAGDLYSQLAQTEKARDAYLLAVATHRAQHDFLTAARILETKLFDCDEAIVCLEAGWPASRQAVQCLRALFHVFGRHGCHEAAHAKVAELHRQMKSEQSVAVVEVLSQVAVAYPDRSMQAATADVTRILAAHCLRTAATHADRPSVLKAIRRLAPEDRLLGRDCERFQQLQPLASTPVQRATRRTPRPSGELTLIRTLSLLPDDVEWRNAVSTGDSFFAAGYDGSCIKVVEGFWNGHLQAAGGVRWPHATPRHVPFLLACGSPEHPVLIRPLGGPSLPWQTFPPTDETPFRIVIGTPPWLSERAVALGRRDDGESSMLVPSDNGLVLSTFSLRNELLGSHVISWHDVWPDGAAGYHRSASESIPFLMRGDRAYLGLGERLVCWRPEGRMRVVDVGDTIVRMHCSARFSRARVAISLQAGAMLLWDDYQALKSPFAEDMAAPVLRFIDGGWLVAASEHACNVYRTTENCKVHCEATVCHKHGAPIAVLNSGQKDRFAMVTEKGTVVLYQLVKR
ncbi:MAG: hypothetical protein U1E05_07225, partial [Patescibacteria group bacterium]|nr:hypothetical protein [Patescibacteria group bacterium]